MNNLPQSFPNQNGMSLPIQFFHSQNVGLPMNSQLNGIQPLIFNPLPDWTNHPHLHPYLFGNLGRRIQHHPVVAPPPPIAVRTPTQSDRMSISLVCASLLSKAFSEIKQKEKKESPPLRLSRSLPPIGLPCEGMEDEDDEMPHLLPFSPIQQLHIQIPSHPIQSISSNDLLVLAPPSPDSSSLPTISANRLGNSTSSEGHESDEGSEKSVIYVSTQRRIVDISSDEDEKEGKVDEEDQKDSEDEESESEDEEDSDDDESPSPEKEVLDLSGHGFEWRRSSALAASSQITMTLKGEDDNEKVEKEEKRFKRVMKRTAASYTKKQARMMKRGRINKASKIHTTVGYRIAKRCDVEMVVKGRKELKKEDEKFEDSEEEEIDIMG